MSELNKTDLEAAARRFTEVNDGELVLVCQWDSIPRHRTVRVYTVDVDADVIPCTHDEHRGTFLTSNYLVAWVKMLSDATDTRQQANVFRDKEGVLSWMRMMQMS